MDGWTSLNIALRLWLDKGIEDITGLLLLHSTWVQFDWQLSHTPWKPIRCLAGEIAVQLNHVTCSVCQQETGCTYSTQQGTNPWLSANAESAKQKSFRAQIRGTKALWFSEGFFFITTHPAPQFDDSKGNCPHCLHQKHSCILYHLGHRTMWIT